MKKWRPSQVQGNQAPLPMDILPLTHCGQVTPKGLNSLAGWNMFYTWMGQARCLG